MKQKTRTVIVVFQKHEGGSVATKITARNLPELKKSLGLYEQTTKADGPTVQRNLVQLGYRRVGPEPDLEAQEWSEVYELNQ